MSTTISITVSDELANRLSLVSTASHRTVGSLVTLCLLDHLPTLEEAAKYVSVFTPAAGPEPKVEKVEAVPSENGFGNHVRTFVARRHGDDGGPKRNPRPPIKPTAWGEAWIEAAKRASGGSLSESQTRMLAAIAMIHTSVLEHGRANYSAAMQVVGIPRGSMAIVKKYVCGSLPRSITDDMVTATRRLAPVQPTTTPTPEAQ